MIGATLFALLVLLALKLAYDLGHHDGLVIATSILLDSDSDL